MGWLKKVGKGLKKVGKAVGKVAKKVAPIAVPIIAGLATGGIGGLGAAGTLGGNLLASTGAKVAAGLGVGLLAKKLLQKKKGGGGGGGQPVTGEVAKPITEDPAKVGEEAKPLAMPTADMAVVEEAKRKAMLKRQQAGGRRSTIIADTTY